MQGQGEFVDSFLASDCQQDKRTKKPGQEPLSGLTVPRVAQYVLNAALDIDRQELGLDSDAFFLSKSWGPCCDEV